MTYEEYNEKRDQLIALSSWNEIDGDEYHRQMGMLVEEFYGQEHESYW